MNARFFQFALAAAIASLAVGADAFSAVNAQSFSYQGRVLNSAGTAPLTGIAEIKFEILNHAKDCVLYAEKQSVDLGTTGIFAIQVGSAIGDAKRTAAGNDSGNAMGIVFANSGSVPGVGSGCPYSPAAGDVRYLRVTVTPNAGAPVTLNPDQALGSTPQALVAETLQGKTPSEFVQITGNGSTAYSLAKMDLDKIFGAGDAQGLHHHDNEYVKLGSTPSFSSLTISGTPTASTDACTKGYTDTRFGGSTLDLTGLTANQSVKWDGTKWVTHTPVSLGSTAGSAMDAGAVPNCAAGEKLQMSAGPAFSWSCVADLSQWATNGSNVSYSGGNVGIGTTNPGQRLEVNGSIKMTDGNQAAGKVLTSDANGVASWQTPSGGGSSTQSVSTSTTVTTGQAGTFFIATAEINFTLPSAASAGSGFVVSFKHAVTAGGTVTVTPVGADTIDGQTSYSLFSPYDSVKLVSTGSAWVIESEEGQSVIFY